VVLVGAYSACAEFIKFRLGLMSEKRYSIGYINRR
jgi:hypothetical protein